MGINLHRMELDQYGNIYVSSRGDYYDTYSETFVIDSNTDKVIEELPLLPNTEMAICRDSLYVYSTEWSYYTNSWTVSYATDGTEKSIKIPYGIAINPETGEFFVTDAKDYVTPGTLYCFSRDGKKKWSVITGDIPAHIAFTDKKLKEIQ